MEERHITVVGISGSLRKGSYTRLALDEALRGAEATGARVRVFDPREFPLPFCDGSGNADDPNVAALRDAVEKADGLILATPEYHGSFSGILKNALDLLSFDQMEEKVCGLVSVLGGQSNSNSLNHLRIVCRQVHSWVVPHQASVGASYRAFGDDGQITDEKIRARVRRVGEDVVRYARLLRENPELAEVE
ncbi:MAG: NADPH-dependent FMN reductase [Sumerlaeia bacterium]